MEFNDNTISKMYETGEERLSQLIKQAGDDARKRKKKTLAIHYKKLKTVVAEGVTRRQNNELSEIVL